jgi:hypothetical protein
MALEIRKVEYFNILVDNGAEEAYELLTKFANVGISLLAFKAIPVEHNQTQFSLFPNDSLKMRNEAREAGINLEGPHSALIIKSNSDEPGECAGIFKKLSQVNINVIESSGIADLYGSYGVVLYLKQGDCEKAIAALKG